MKYVLTGQQMKECDEKTIREFGVGSPVLMERAALACVDELLQLFLWEENQRREPAVLIVCGKGNNGGDGAAVGRILAERGIRCQILMAGGRERLSPDCSVQLGIAEKYGVAITDRDRAMKNLASDVYDVVVDAMFGVGLSRDLEEPYVSLIGAINGSSAKVLAVDIPSGIHADTGQCMGRAVRADVTVTFAFYKRGHLLYPGRAYCGVCKVHDIGITEMALSKKQPLAFCYEKEDLARLPERQASSNKGTYGKVLMIAGSRQICGAAYLSGMAAYKTGAGLVQVLTEETNRAALQQMMPEALLAFYRADENETAAGADSAGEILTEKLSWPTVIGIGPGIGTGAAAKTLLDTVLENQAVPVVIDADGLNLLAEDPGVLRSRTKISGTAKKETEKDLPLILTPHMAEMSRLTGIPVEKLKEDPVRYAKETAEAYHCVCVLKDACTAVCDHEGRCFLNTSGNSGMSTGGSGDVLTGVICALLAQHMPAFEAASLGVYLHGLAGDTAAVSTGEYGLVAGNLLKGIEDLIHGK